jgi:transcriptional regulator with GAF, ATPase, and Fis domain
VQFLDEIGLMPMALQPKFLTALDEGTVRRLGAMRNELVKVAIIAATNEDLQVAMREKRFREDLYSRLAVVTLHLPPLRARGATSRSWPSASWQERARTTGSRRRRSARTHARRCGRMGGRRTVRELRNVMERVALEVDASTVRAEGLGLPQATPAIGAVADSETEEQERDRLLETLGRTDWNLANCGAAREHAADGAGPNPALRAS